MKRNTVLFFILLMSNLIMLNGQNIDKIGRKIIISNDIFREIYKDSICHDGIVQVQGIFIYPPNYILFDTTGVFFATYCDKAYKIGFRFEFAFSQYIYNKSVNEWLGYHQGTNINFTIIYDKLNFGIRFKPWTTNPKSEMIFDNKVLPKNADINPFKFDYFVGYNFEFNDNYSIEPSIGYTHCTFKVINEDKINQNFTFNSTNGFLFGLTFNKYARLATFKYLGGFIRFNYGLVDYSKVHNNLGKGYFEICFGTAFKFYWTKRVYNIVK